MEHNTVRFVDNFSAGTRGASSVEYFVEQGYAVLFVYRNNSIRPYIRHFSGATFLDCLQVSADNPDTISVKPEVVPKLRPILDRYARVKRDSLLLSVEFTTLAEYLWLLRTVCESLQDEGNRVLLYLAAAVADFYIPADQMVSTCVESAIHLAEYLWLLRTVCESLQDGGNRVLLYLAAAVADFYIPADQMPEHKMQSGDGPPVISLQLVPKMLSPLTSVWSPRAFVVSFKLETDPNILVKKARAALDKYHHKLVIGNLLHTRKHQVILVSAEAEVPITLSEEDKASGVEIEKYLVQEVTRRHEAFRSDGK
ncbi:phosphopantothenate--cysteine ligase isoform X1 [Diaphorina citri]|uniref:Phosphopantothenate--cysteine ligase isoform X1 n=2 Tax=Diaphorina citri TaxID=121845 RepID=A0A3Q0IZD0_DIACI|nr:phosphopantothenate--cysteine ligase isoform X1 [Diaphorina citri]